jgi:ABC-type lipoprotein export system ATPase subunit
MTVAACRRVTVTHGSGVARVRALDEVTMNVEERARLAVVGRSGSGKTTLLHVLGAIVEPSTGSVEWQGGPQGAIASSALDDAARRFLRRRIGIVFQGANLLPHFDAGENVAFAALASGADPDAAARLLALVGLEAKARHLPSELSAGEQQRVAIARALAQRPLLVLCDEPTGHLDGDTGERVLDLLDALQRELGFALVLATHDADVAARFDRILVMHDGRIIGSADA